MLIDRATLYVRSGKGGHGCMSFRREKFIPKGGPDGGNGGRGGDVVLVADPNLDTLLPLTPRPHYRAESGKAGMGKSCIGRDGADCIVKVPMGPLVFDRDSGELLADISAFDQRVIVAGGGHGGRGGGCIHLSGKQVWITPGGMVLADGKPGEESWPKRICDRHLTYVSLFRR